MFRTAVLSMVLTVAAGPSVTLLCRTWCNPHVAVASGCHHEDRSTSVSTAGGDRCKDVVLRAGALLREDVRRGVFSPRGERAISVLRYQFARSTIDARLGPEPGRDWSLDKRPLTTALRI